MPLQSALFSGDAKLEAAAVSDPAHIVTGARGDHVKKIQIALIRLDGATIVPDGIYGPGTSAAVLAYKRKRAIINSSYQTTADDIVGKMTMARLDAEMLVFEAKPVILSPVFPAPRFPTAPRPASLNLSFSVADSGPSNVPNIIPKPPGPDIQTVEVIISPGAVGTMNVLLAAGGKVARLQGGENKFYGLGKNDFQVARIPGAQTSGKAQDVLDIKQDTVIVAYQALFCGETFFHAESAGGKNISDTVRLLSLADKAVPVSPSSDEDFSPDPNFPTGFLSKSATPLNPRPGRSINLFGEGETPGFENYASDIDFCSHTFSKGNGPDGAKFGNRPWTNDPRKPPGIAGKSVQNISARSTPLNDLSIAEIFRIAASGCRFTYGEAKGRILIDKIFPKLKGVRVIEPIKQTSQGDFAFIVELP